VNFNKDDASLIYDMRRAVDALVELPYLWWWLKHYDGGRQVDFTDANSLDIERIRLRAAFEHKGKHNKGLHVHILIEIAHDTMVQVSKFGLCEVFRKFVKENPNCHCRFLKGSGEDKDFILQYITKEVPSYAPESQLNSRLKYAFSGSNQEVSAENSAP
jgi:hypothetical protein